VIPPVVGISFDGVCLNAEVCFFHGYRFIMYRIFFVDTYALRERARVWG
jgi:hypothetical protein